MLAVLQTNGLRRASNKNVLGLSLLANTHLLYEEKQETYPLATQIT